MLKRGENRVSTENGRPKRARQGYGHVTLHLWLRSCVMYLHILHTVYNVEDQVTQKDMSILTYRVFGNLIIPKLRILRSPRL